MIKSTIYQSIILGHAENPSLSLSQIISVHSSSISDVNENQLFIKLQT